jgi:hypothetical protein
MDPKIQTEPIIFMAKTKSEKAYQKFEGFMKRLLAVPKAELQAKELEFKKQRVRRKKKA